MSKKRRESHLRTSMGQTAQDAWIGGWGQPNLGNAWILGTYGQALPPLLPKGEVGQNHTPY